MIMPNFSYPLNYAHITRMEPLTSRTVEREIEIHSEIDPQQPSVPQLVPLANQAGLSPAEWQTLPMLVNPPSLNFVTVTLLAELHARCGYFPAHLRMRPQSGVIPPQYEVAEILDLQAVRNAARQRR